MDESRLGLSTTLNKRIYQVESDVLSPSSRSPSLPSPSFLPLPSSLPLCIPHRGTSWLRGPAVEHWSLAGVLSLSCARLVDDG